MEESFDILTEQFRPMVLSYLRTVTRDAHLAEDLAQETFLTAHRSLERFDASGDFGAWLRGIARNLVRQQGRTRARRQLVIDSRIVEGMEQVYEMFDRPSVAHQSWQERLQILDQCIAELSQRLRGALERTYRHGQSLQEVAGAEQSTPEAIGQRLTRARRLVRQCVETRTREDIDD